MVAGFLVVAYLSGLDQSVAALFGGHGVPRPDWMPVIEFPWRIMFGTLATVAVALCFKTPVHKRAGMV
jgi:SSS family solute:Na+ symporter